MRETHSEEVATLGVLFCVGLHVVAAAVRGAVALRTVYHRVLKRQMRRMGMNIGIRCPEDIDDLQTWISIRHKSPETFDELESH